MITFQMPQKFLLIIPEVAKKTLDEDARARHRFCCMKLIELLKCSTVVVLETKPYSQEGLMARPRGINTRPNIPRLLKGFKLGTRTLEAHFDKINFLKKYFSSK
jgi:hypothetical protein